MEEDCPSWRSTAKRKIMSKTILITGASSGIGKASAKLFAADGWDVIATMRDPAKGQELRTAGNVLVARLDVQDIKSIELAVEEGVRHFGGIDVLLNNAGYGQYGIFEAIPRKKVLEQFEVNVFGPMDVIRAVLPAMRKAHSGVIYTQGWGNGYSGDLLR
jgi:NAD(P)-dependent dehydrogenase (short-subunit alcohol dehydrogenase family)